MPDLEAEVATRLQARAGAVRSSEELPGRILARVRWVADRRARRRRAARRLAAVPVVAGLALAAGVGLNELRGIGGSASSAGSAAGSSARAPALGAPSLGAPSTTGAPPTSHAAASGPAPGHAPSHQAAPGSPNPTSKAPAGCPTELGDKAKPSNVVFQGVALPGPTAGGLLRSPARFRAQHYLRGHGPAIVRVETAIPAAGTPPASSGPVKGQISPRPGQSWFISATGNPGSATPLTTSTCQGSHLLAPPR